jgi:hypothetical protein
MVLAQDDDPQVEAARQATSDAQAIIQRHHAELWGIKDAESVGLRLDPNDPYQRRIDIIVTTSTEPTEETLNEAPRQEEGLNVVVEKIRTAYFLDGGKLVKIKPKAQSDVKLSD